MSFFCLLTFRAQVFHVAVFHVPKPLSGLVENGNKKAQGGKGRN